MAHVTVLAFVTRSTDMCIGVYIDVHNIILSVFVDVHG